MTANREALRELCLSFLTPPSYAGGSWTLNPGALADAIIAAGWTAAAQPQAGEAHQWPQPQPLVCNCDYSPHTTGPERDCPEHGDVRAYASWFHDLLGDYHALSARLAEAERERDIAQHNADVWMEYGRGQHAGYWTLRSAVRAALDDDTFLTPDEVAARIAAAALDGPTDQGAQHDVPDDGSDTDPWATP